MRSSRSLRNESVSPGWTREEIELLRLAVMKFGVGQWSQIVRSGCLPGKTRSQLQLQLQRLLGQQSTREFTRVHLDTEAVRERNQRRKESAKYTRKNGIRIYQGLPRPRHWYVERLAKNCERYGLPPDQYCAITLPDHSARIRDEGEERIKALRARLALLEAERDRRRRAHDIPYPKRLALDFPSTP